MRKIACIFSLLCSLNIFGQQFYFGNDLSSVNQWEDAGTIYKKNNVAKDVFQIFADEGTNLIRVRLWYDPSWWQGTLQQPAGVKPWYNDFEDVRKTIFRAKQKGMKVMLDIHYSDFWADPGIQLVPRNWIAASANVNILADSVYQYTKRVLLNLNNENLMPDLVKVGNENNPGILCHIPQDQGFGIKSTLSTSWARHAILYNAAFRAVREVGAIATVNPKIVLHFSNALANQVWNYQNVINNGITDFDIMGISYYYAWHAGSIPELESTLKAMKTKFPKYDVMVAETGYAWSTTYWCDNANNIIGAVDSAYLPASPENQLKYLVDYTKAVKRAGGVGIIFWEPAQVCTNIDSPWGVGSAQEHVSFFDSSNGNFMENGGGKWTNQQFYSDTSIAKSKVTFQVDMTGQDVSNGVYLVGETTNWDFTAMQSIGNQNYSIQLTLNPGDQLIYYYIRNNSWTNYQTYRETVPPACAQSNLKPGGWSGDRLIIVPNNDTIVQSIFGGCQTTPIMEYRQSEINIYPNPSNGKFTINFENEYKNPSVFVYDTQGRAVYRNVITGSPKKIMLDLSHLGVSIYFLKVIHGSQSLYKQLIIQ